MRKLYLFCLVIFFYLFHIVTVNDGTPEIKTFEDWVLDFKIEAMSKGISEDTFNKAFENIDFNERIIALDRRQTEFTYTIWQYLDRVVNKAKINTAKSLMKKHKKLLSKIEKKYGVPKSYIIAFWGIESNFGMNFGGFNIIEALATLSYDYRRPSLFKNELLQALLIIEENKIPPSDMKGSWAGAMGNFQFLPSTYMKYAVDFDKDGKKDIWHSLPDSFASAANYLSQIGWQTKQKWGREIYLPKNISWVKLDSHLTRTVSDWKKIGVKPADKKNFLGSNLKATIVFPAGYKGPIFLTYPNFNVITQWNNSTLYAIAVGHFSDRIVGESPLKTPRKKLYIPSSDEVKKAQSYLIQLGFYDGHIDGILGLKTRQGIRIAQQKYNLPIDGYLSKELLRKMKERNF